jgi:hypothetical protein
MIGTVDLPPDCRDMHDETCSYVAIDMRLNDDPDRIQEN